MSNSMSLGGMAIGEFSASSVKNRAEAWLEEQKKVALADELLWKARKLTYIQKQSKRWFSKYRRWTDNEMVREVEILWSKGDEYSLPGKYWIHDQTYSEKEKIEQILAMANRLPKTMYLSEIAVALLQSKPKTYYTIKGSSNEQKK